MVVVVVGSLEKKEPKSCGLTWFRHTCISPKFGMKWHSCWKHRKSEFSQQQLGTGGIPHKY